MKLGRHFQIVLLSALMVFLCLAYAVQRYYVYSTFLAIEQSHARDEMQVCIGAMEREEHQLVTLMSDWAFWNDTYKFVEDGNDAYIETNLDPEVFKTASLNLIFFVRSTGEVVWGKVVSPGDGQEMELALFSQAPWPRNSRLLPANMTEDRMSGVVLTEHGPLMIAWGKILTSGREGPARGTIVMGRFLTAEVIEALSQKSSADFVCSPIDGQASSDEERRLARRVIEHGILIEADSAENPLRIYTTYPDIDAKPALLLRLLVSREISRTGASAMRISLLMLFGAGGITLLILQDRLQRTVVKPLAALADRISGIRTSDRLSMRLRLARRDEIGSLANEFDAMLDRIEADIATRKAAEEALRLSENRYAATLMGLGDGVITTNARGSVELLNPVAEKLTGWSQDEARGRPLAEVFRIIDEITRVARENPVEEVIAHGVIASLENRTLLVARDGTERPIGDSGAPIRNERGALTGVVLVFRDRSAEREAEKQLRASETKLRTITDMALNAILMMDADGNITYYNRSAERMFGWTADEAIGKDLHRLLAPALYRTTSESGIAHFRETGEGPLVGRTREVVAVKKDGTKFSVEVALAGVKLGGTWHAVGVVRDITERKQMEEELRFRNVLLSTQQEVAIDGILVVDEQGRIQSFNRRFADMWGIPSEIIESKSDERALKFVLDSLVEPDRFLEKVMYLYHHRDETSRDEILLKDGRTFDRYSAPMNAGPGKYYGRVWYFRDITERKQMQEALQESGRFLHASMDALSANIVILDESSRILFANKAWRRFATANNVDPDGVSEGANYLAVCDGAQGADAETARRFALALRAILAGHLGLFELEYPCHSPDEQRWFIARVTAFAVGDEVRAAVAHEDITERKQTEAILLQSEERHRALFVGASDAIMTMEAPTWTFTSGNPASLAMFGVRTEQEFLALGPAAVSPERQPGGRLSSELAQEMMEIALREGRHFFEWRHKRLGGEEFPATVLLTRLQIRDRVLLQATVRDVSQQKQLELELTQAQKLEAVGRLAAGIAHEINTPTQYVGDNIEFLQIAYDSLAGLAAALPGIVAAARDGPIPEPVLDHARDLLEKAKLEYLAEQVPRAIAQSLDGVGRISTIVQAMKEFSHPGIAEKTSVDLNQCIRSTVTVSRNEWKYVADVELNLDESLPPVFCLPGDVNQAILNIIVNAAHSIGDVVGDGGERKGTITVSTRQDDAWVEIRITDTGTGIPEELRTRIFDPFFTTKEVGRGTGQGLAISRNVIVDRHRGTITLESEVGKGSTFIIRLPIEDEAAGDAPGPSDRHAG